MQRRFDKNGFGTRFETEAQGNLEMAYSYIMLIF